MASRIARNLKSLKTLWCLVNGGISQEKIGFDQIS